MRYYVWLVQRKLSSNHLTLDLKSLNLPVGTKVIAEEVSANAYGEVVWIKETSEEGQLSFELPAQSVMLLTIPICSNATRHWWQRRMQPLRPGQIVRKLW